MSPSKKKILYLSIGGRSKLFAKDGPSEFFFGGREFLKDGHHFAIMEIDSNDYKISVNWFIRAINRPISIFLGFPFGYFWCMITQKNIIEEFNKYDQIIVTTARLGLPLLLLKKFYKLIPHITYITMGLVNHDTQFFKVWLYRMLISQEVSLSTLSRPEAAYVESKLKNNVKYIPFGVDLDFWTPSKFPDNSSSYVFSIGNDLRRDFSLLIDSWQSSYPKLIIVTSLPIVSNKVNIEIKKGSWHGQEFSDSELRDLYRGAEFVIVPSKQTQQPSGQSVTLQAMSCGKTVIYPDIMGIWDNEVMIDNDNFLLYKPESSKSLSKKIEYALSNRENLIRIGLLARKTVEREYSVKSMANKILFIGGNLN